MSDKLTIGLTYTGFDEKHQNYVNWLKEEANVEVVKLTAGESATDLSNIDGLVMSGGVDVHPSYYNGNEVYENKPSNFNTARDAFEKELYLNAFAQHKPVLGICRGMQFINCLQGGSLTQDLGIEGNVTHRATEADKQHTAVVNEGTLLNEIVEERKIHINSAHHQSIKDIAPNLMVTAVSADGVVEAMEWKEKEGKPFFLGVQWHPERMYKFGLQDTAVSKNIRQAFIKAVQQHKHSSK